MLYHIFLSYSRKDASLMRKVRDHLRAEELSVWTDEGIEPGTPLWDQAIETALANAGCMVVILTPNAINSKGLRDEIHYARIHGVYIFPLLAGGDARTSVPYTLSGTQWVDIRSDFPGGVAKIASTVRVHLRLDAPAAPLPEAPPEEPPPRPAPAPRPMPRLNLPRLNLAPGRLLRGLRPTRLLWLFPAVVLVLAGLAAVGMKLASDRYYGILATWGDEIAALANYQPEFHPVRLLDADSSPFAELTSEQGGARQKVALENISPYLIHAVVSVEDPRFFEAAGAAPDWVSLLPALLDLQPVESGAATITGQIARQLVLKDAAVSPERALQERIIEAEITRRYTQNEILELYLNEVYFGNQSYGVEAAAQFYFDQSADDLDLAESALLAGLIAAPAAYDPVTQREAAFERMGQVIARMQEVGCLGFQQVFPGDDPFCIDQSMVRDAIVEQAAVKARVFQPRALSYQNPHFVNFVQQIIERDYGAGEMYRRGFVIRTTLDTHLQKSAEQALQAALDQGANTGLNTGAIMVTDPATGAIRAMVGSPDFHDDEIDGQANGALTWQAAGTAIKPVVYAAALEGVPDPSTGEVVRYLTPASILWDVPTTFNTVPSYSPVNFDGAFRGPVAVRYALQNDLNVPAVKAFDFIGVEHFQGVAARLGLTFSEGAQFGLPTALGAVDVRLYDMMAAYGTLANNGALARLYAVESITDADGTLVPVSLRSESEARISPQVAYLMQNILSDDNARAEQFGTNSALSLSSLPASSYVAAKTGVTDQNRDLWTMGFTTNAVVGVWLGRADDAPTSGGFSLVAPLWNQVMTAALREFGPPQPFNNPAGVVPVQVCALTGTLPPASCPALRNELVLADQMPPSVDEAFYQVMTVDSWTGLRANQFCPDNQVERTYLKISDAAVADWLLNRPIGVSLARQLGLPSDLERAPTEACDLNTEIPIARITSPAEGQQVSGEVQVVGSASAPSLASYYLELAPGNSNNFIPVSLPTASPQTNGVLGTWDTTSVPNGQYILRLAMTHRNGGYLYRSVNVTVNNTVPTPTPGSST
ncbi:MAG: hypothetical protein BroJett038_17090 [Chloroflexota bacterium]|nr:MAG: hypothetical protein BroJett038_17090 [Chloroflexota bacterium]